MDQKEEKRQVEAYFDGLRRYIKRESKGKLLGQMLAPNWAELTENQQDKLISDAFVVHAVRLTQEARTAIHGKEETKDVRPNRRRR